MERHRHPSPPRLVSYTSASLKHTHFMRSASPHQVPRPPRALSAGAIRRDAIEPDCLLAGAGRALTDRVLGCARAPRASVQVQVMGMYGGYASPRSQSPGAVPRSISPTGIYVQHPQAGAQDVMVFASYNPQSGMMSPVQCTSPRHPSPVQHFSYVHQPPPPLQLVHQQAPPPHAWRQAGASEMERVVYRAISPNSVMPAGTGERGQAQARHLSPDQYASRFESRHAENSGMAARAAERGRAPTRDRHPSPVADATRYANSISRPDARNGRLRHACLPAIWRELHCIIKSNVMFLRQFGGAAIFSKCERVACQSHAWTGWGEFQNPTARTKE